MVDVFGQKIFKNLAEPSAMISELIAVIFTIYLNTSHESVSYIADDDEEQQQDPCLFLITDLLSKVNLEGLVVSLSGINFEEDNFMSVVVKDRSVLKQLDDYCTESDELLSNTMLVHIMTVLAQNMNV